MPEAVTVSDFLFSRFSWFFGSIVQRVDFSTISAKIVEKPKNRWIFDQKSILTKIAGRFGKSIPNPFQRRRNRQKIFTNGREITILVYFWGVPQWQGGFWKGNFEKIGMFFRGFSAKRPRIGFKLARGSAPATRDLWKRFGRGWSGLGHRTTLI